MCGCFNEEKNHVAYVHLKQDTGEIAYANCNCNAGKGGCCKHAVALLFQLLEYIQLDSKVIPDDLICTQLLQQWHVPRNDGFERASYEKDKSGKKTQEIEDM